MKIWLIVDGEPLPLKCENDRLLRIGILANELCLLQHEVTWWSSDFNHHKKKFRATNESYQICSNKLTIKLIKSPGYKKNISLRRIFHNIIVARRFKRQATYADKPDLILCCMPTIELSEEAVRFGKLFNIPTVIDLRDMWPDIFLYSVPTFLRGLSRLVFHPSFRKMKYLCTNATNLVGVSEGYLDWGLNYAQRERNINDAVFPLGYADIFANNVITQSDKDNFLNKMGCSKNDFIIVYLGSLTSKINFNHIIEAVSEIGGSVRLVIAGLGDTYDSLLKICDKKKNISLTGWLNKEQIFQLLSIASVGLYPYPNRKDFNDHFPNKFVEYLCSGLPILSRVNSPEMKSFLQKYNCGVIYEDDKESLIRIIQNLASDKLTLREMSLSSRDVYLKKYCSKIVYRNMSDYLINLTNPS